MLALVKEHPSFVNFLKSFLIVGLFPTSLALIWVLFLFFCCNPARALISGWDSKQRIERTGGPDIFLGKAILRPGTGDVHFPPSLPTWQIFYITQKLLNIYPVVTFFWGTQDINMQRLGEHQMKTFFTSSRMCEIHKQYHFRRQVKQTPRFKLFLHSIRK